MDQGFRRVLVLVFVFVLVAVPANAMGLLPGGGAIPSSGGTEALATMAAGMSSGTWADAGTQPGVTAATLSSVVWNCSSSCSPGPTAATIAGTSGPHGLMSLWSGAAFDSDNRQLLVWGGGHQGYYGNEVYAFKFSTLNWVRLTTPSPDSVSPNNSAITADGTPAPPHPYQSPVYVPSVGLLHMAQMFYSDSANTSANVLKFVPAAQSPSAIGVWSVPTTIPGTLGAEVVAAYDSSTNKIYTANSADSVAARVYSVSGNSWSSIGNTGLADYHMTGAINPGIRFVAVGNGFINNIDLSTGTNSTASTSGPQTCQNGNAPGFVWDSAISAFACWTGGQTIYTLNAAGTTWASHSMTGATPACSDSGDCTSSTGVQNNGTFSRFFYDPTNNVFLVVNTIDDHVFVAKL